MIGGIHRARSSYTDIMCVMLVTHRTCVSPGGRAGITVYPEKGYLDMGGQYIGGTQNYLQFQIAKYTLPTVPTYLNEQKNFYYELGSDPADPTRAGQVLAVPGKLVDFLPTAVIEFLHIMRFSDLSTFDDDVHLMRNGRRQSLCIPWRSLVCCAPADAVQRAGYESACYAGRSLGHAHRPRIRQVR